MKSKFAKLAIAVGIIAAIGILGYKYTWTIDGTTTAYAAVKKALIEMPCVHIAIKGHQNQNDYQRDYWFSFGSGIKIEKFPDGTIRSVNLKNHKMYVYDPNSNKITISYYEESNEPLLQIKSADNLLSDFLQDFDTWGAKVTAKNDYYNGTEVVIYSAALPEIDYSPGVKMKGAMELVVDRSSQLPITAKLRANGVDGTVLFEGSMMFDYPEKNINDIYALIVPKSAEVVDNVETQAAVLLDRLDSRVEKGFGTVVAILTESFIKDNQAPQKRAIRIIGEKNHLVINAYYRLNKGGWGYPAYSKMSTISTWPLPDVNEVLSLGRETLPSLFFVSDGVTGWHGKYDNTCENYIQFEQITNKQNLHLERLQWGLSGMIWPGRQNMDFDRSDRQVRAELLHGDEQHQYSIGLRVNETISGSGSVEWIYWIDPTRDDMVVEQIFRDYQQSQKPLEDRTKYLDHMQLPNGQWYPSHWQMAVMGQVNGDSKERCIIDYNLQVYQGMKLDEWWFAGLVNKLKTHSSLD